MDGSRLLTFIAPIFCELWCTVVSEEYSRIIVFKEPVPNKVLKGHSIRTEKVADEGNCRVLCYLEPNCVSINIGPQEDGGTICQLNNNTDESLSSSTLLKNNCYTYYGIENPCHSNPCSCKSDLCQAGFTDKGFRCIPRERKEAQCGKDCQGPLGMENGEISDTKISASSEYDSYHSANQGRLHFKATGDKGGTWGARLPDANQWLQVDLGTECFILTRVATQGGNRYLAWVGEYHLEFVSNAGRNFQYYRERGSTNKMVFIGNNDSNSVVAHDLKPPIEARYVRFRPLVWHHWVSMRVELYGCSKVCPLYWKPFGNLRYAIFTTERSWSDGEAFCNSLGARLVKITSDDESAFVNSILPGNYPSDKPYWIGLCEDEPNKKWKWSDGSELGVYTNWKEDEPNQFQDILACTVLVGGEWRDRQCSDKYFFICEK